MDPNHDLFEDSNKSPSNPVEIEDIGVNLDDERLRFPLKTLISSVLLFLVGSSLLIAGLIEEFVEEDKSKGMAMWIIGAITFIPGFYYTYLFIRAYRAKTPRERIRILNEIPDM
ncbi:hypothetical protein SteCoe_32163 [Stentor coeruleus]|uniref:Transmembrane protein 230 n=1 Tax=Stentor coeruleus TaxID=5963 RepID=A0A1R2AZM8_9CILI|nr:hypothetical protein SteCoe_32163 [Stentor coeruleus]